MAIDLFAALVVTDRARAVDWYSRLLGADPVILYEYMEKTNQFLVPPTRTGEFFEHFEMEGPIRKGDPPHSIVRRGESHYTERAHQDSTMGGGPDGHANLAIGATQRFVEREKIAASAGILLKAANEEGQRDFILSDYQDLGLDYARTLRVWEENFNANYAQIRSLGFDASFRRKWNYYFAYCEAAFSMRNITVAQIGMTRPNNYQPD